ncbi:hypothetical protein HY734_00995 [Candidatus Uhrbacteria bacterium]|nr:hypothetical protein [Candidatus Uhrbacteria bacterium]
MTFRWFMLVMGSATLAMWFAWGYVLFGIDPTTAGFTAFVFFYLTLFVALLGTFTLATTTVRRHMRKDELVSRHVLVSFRQGVLFSLLLIASLALLARGLLTWWNILLLVAIVSALELAFLASQAFRRSVKD